VVLQSCVAELIAQRYEKVVRSVMPKPEEKARLFDETTIGPNLLITYGESVIATRNKVQKVCRCLI